MSNKQINKFKNFTYQLENIKNKHIELPIHICILISLDV